MGKSISVAYEEAHECAEGCACESSSAYLDQVQQSLADLGSADPAGDVARNAKYVRGAKKAKLEPKQAAAMIMAMSQRDPADYQPRYRYEDVAGETAHEYVAVDSRGRKVFGPSKDYEQAKRHAAQAGGVVHFVMGASESCACGASDCVGVHTHGPPPAGTTVVAAAEGEGTPHYRELDLAPPPAPLEPYTKELRWHRDPALDSTYHAESPLGRFTVLKRTPDRRHDVLPWQVLRKGEPIGQADDKAGAYKVAAKFARSPNGRASKRVEPAACVAVVERTPGCMPTSTRLDSPKDAFEIMKGRYARQGHETFEVLGSSVQGFMVGSPITVAVGDTTSVQVSVTQVLAAAIGLAAAGATTVFCIHGHPSGKAQPSDKDRDLTRAIKAGFRAALPNVKFGGHIVAGQKTFSLA